MKKTCAMLMTFATAFTLNAEFVSRADGFCAQEIENTFKLCNSIKLNITGKSIAALSSKPELASLIKTQIERLELYVLRSEKGMRLCFNFFPVKESDFSVLLSGIKTESDLSEAAFISADTMASWATAASLDKQAIGALANIFKKSASETSNFLAQAILDGEVFNPGMGRYAEAFEGADSMILIAKSKIDFETLLKKAKRLSVIYEKAKGEDAGARAPERAIVNGLEAVIAPFSFHSIHSIAYSAACIVGDYEIAASSRTPERALVLLSKYAAIVKNNEPVSNNLEEKLGAAHRILCIQPSLLFEELQKAFGTRRGISFSLKYDLEDKIEIGMPLDLKFDPVEIRVFLNKNFLSAETVLTTNNIMELFFHFEREIHDIVKKIQKQNSSGQ